MVSFTRAPREQETILLERKLTDLMKFLSCLMVAMSHYSGYALAKGGSSSIIYKVIAATGGYLGVAFFFFLSGYGLMMSDKKNHLNLSVFFKKRLLKTYFPAVVISALWLGVAAIVDFDLLCNQHFFLGVFWHFNDEVMWFVNTIIVMYVFFGLYSVIPFTNPISHMTLLVMVGIIAYWFIRLCGIGSSLSVPLFFVGIAVAQFPSFFKQLFCCNWIIMLIGCISVVLLWLFRHDNYLIHGWVNYATISIFLFAIIRYNITIELMPNWVGSCSYDVYLVHHKVHLFILHSLVSN